MLRVQGRAVDEEELRQILQARRGGCTGPLVSAFITAQVVVTLHSLLPFLLLQAYVVEEGQEGDIEASPEKPAGAARLLGSLGLKRAPQAPSQRSIKPLMPGGWSRPVGARKQHVGAPARAKPAECLPTASFLADLDKVAHCIMQRFGEESAGSTLDDERASGTGSGRGSGSGSGDGSGSGGGIMQHGKHLASPPAASRPAGSASQQCSSSEFSIAAIRAGSLAAQLGDGGGDARPGAPSPHLVGSPQQPSNGRRLVHAMQTETEQRGAADAGASLVQLQGSLAAAQQRLLDSQQQLISQQASVLQAVGSAAAGVSLQPGGGSAADTGWGLLGLPSFRQRAVARSDSGRASALLPPGRPPISSARGGGLERLSSQDGH